MARKVKNIDINDDLFWKLLTHSLRRKKMKRFLWASIVKKQAQDGHYFYVVEIINLEGDTVKDILGDNEPDVSETERENTRHYWEHHWDEV